MQSKRQSEFTCFVLLCSYVIIYAVQSISNLRSNFFSNFFIISPPFRIQLKYLNFYVLIIYAFYLLVNVFSSVNIDIIRQVYNKKRYMDISSKYDIILTQNIGIKNERFYRIKGKNKNVRISTSKR